MPRKLLNFLQVMVTIYGQLSVGNLRHHMMFNAFSYLFNVMLSFPEFGETFV